MKWVTRYVDEWYELQEDVPKGVAPTICTVIRAVRSAEPRPLPWDVYGMGNTIRHFSTMERAMRAAELYFLEKELDK